MRMRGVGSDGDMDGYGNAAAVSLKQQAARRVSRSCDQFEPAAQGFADAEAFAISARNGAVELAAGFLGRAEAAIGQYGFDIFAGLSGERDFEIVNRGRAVHGERGGVTAVHEIDENRREAAFNDMAAEAPDNSALPGAGLGDSVD